MQWVINLKFWAEKAGEVWVMRCKLRNAGRKKSDFDKVAITFLIVLLCGRNGFPYTLALASTTNK